MKNMFLFITLIVFLSAYLHELLTLHISVTRNTLFPSLTSFPRLPPPWFLQTVSGIHCLCSAGQEGAVLDDESHCLPSALCHGPPSSAV